MNTILVIKNFIVSTSVVNATLLPLCPPGKRPSAHCTGGWVGQRAGLDRFENYRFHWDSITGPSSP